MLTQDNANQVHAALSSIDLPFLTVEFSTLGGIEHASILVTISKQKREEWENGIFHNSSYRMFSLTPDMRLESFSGYNTNKFRAGKVKSVEHAIEKLKTWWQTA